MLQQKITADLWMGEGETFVPGRTRCVHLIFTQSELHWAFMYTCGAFFSILTHFSFLSILLESISQLMMALINNGIFVLFLKSNVLYTLLCV